MSVSLSKEDITFAIAVLGCALSIWNALRDWMSSRKNLTVSIPFAFCNKHNCGYSFVMAEFVNNSKLPITITRVRANIDGNSFELGCESVRMFEYTSPERKGRVADDSVLLPLSIEPLGYAKALFAIPKWPKITSRHIELTIGTNRGEIKDNAEITDIILDLDTMHKRMG